MKIKYSACLVLGLVLTVLLLSSSKEPSVPLKPNVILIMTDDQGYGDLSSHGNPIIKTPEMDKLREESVRFTDFHVAPMCTPTRGQLMTGLDAMRNGATFVCRGRSMIRTDIKLMPEYFSKAGYATGMFGKWHLGDSYPHRPRFRGFQEVLSFRAWGITSLADTWGNSYFDPVLMHNGVDKKYEGYCTDIYFDEAMNWIKNRKSENKPFFVYIPTNTPHTPEWVADAYSSPYQGNFAGKPIPSNFFGMIANIDENIGKLEVFLKKENLQDNTILIFLSDNGTQNRDAQELFNDGMRDLKRSVYEGGHRVPLFIRWKDGKLVHGTDINELTQVQDLLPTLIELCGLDSNKDKFDGTSLASLLKGETKKLDDRMCVSQYRVSGEKWDSAVVMWDKWRLVGENELYHLPSDPGQQRNVATDFPEVAKKMSTYYDKWYDEVSVEYARERYITIGSQFANPMTLYSSDWQGDYCDNQANLRKGTAKGYWDVIVDKEGIYEIELRRWSEGSGKPLIDSYDGSPDSEVGVRPIAKAQLIVGDFNKTVDTRPQDTYVKFRMKLKKGKSKITTNFLDKNGVILNGAFYLKVIRI
ncbi:arylsulfatase [Arenibacter sp. ARW7G5Y1]|uniref:arylsulfatase n=1 Tax=Arenibacter sp. ARW7G5Y1 TaxID=2135619 RepID=UPI000D75AEDE|nr:arylsulfatase [Arenibacter sp. ARW7G5Y1]PXX21487.1 arylsulfatase [Arenibacter sp. ARW7G5Y1]